MNRSFHPDVPKTKSLQRGMGTLLEAYYRPLLKLPPHIPILKILGVMSGSLIFMVLHPFEWVEPISCSLGNIKLPESAGPGQRVFSRLSGTFAPLTRPGWLNLYGGRADEKAAGQPFPWACFIINLTALARFPASEYLWKTLWPGSRDNAGLYPIEGLPTQKGEASFLFRDF
jgi:hypothetical protein